MSAHTHDDIDWAARLSAMRRLDALEQDAITAVASRLTAELPADAVVVDVGSGSGGMSAALAEALRGRGGTLVLVDAVDELLEAARDAAVERGGARVRVDTVIADAGSDDLGTLVPPADLLWASAVVHHLPDQQAAVDRLVGVLRPGGLLAVAEGGLDARCLPWDLGVGDPGLELRLNAARDAWFERLRATMPDAVRMPYGWTSALRRAGLSDVHSFSYLLDHPAPAGVAVRDFVVERITWLGETVGEWLSEADKEAVRRLLDPGSADYLGARDDLYLLNARTVHHGRRS
ncbi:class I SAM-dependent methyltransferase [Prauserella muralis]|nr:class I SAM-dependent methyltransferase [Prauserella muralis]